MKKRIVKKILKNKDVLSYNKNQIKKAETLSKRFEKSQKEDTAPLESETTSD